MSRVARPSKFRSVIAKTCASLSIDAASARALLICAGVLDMDNFAFRLWHRSLLKSADSDGPYSVRGHNLLGDQLQPRTSASLSGRSMTQDRSVRERSPHWQRRRIACVAKFQRRRTATFFDQRKRLFSDRESRRGHYGHSTPQSAAMNISRRSQATLSSREAMAYAPSRRPDADLSRRSFANARRRFCSSGTPSAATESGPLMIAPFLATHSPSQNYIYDTAGAGTTPEPSPAK